MNGGNLGVSTDAPNFCKTSTYRILTILEFVRDQMETNFFVLLLGGDAGRMVNKFRISVKIFFYFFSTNLRHVSYICVK